MEKIIKSVEYYYGMPFSEINKSNSKCNGKLIARHLLESNGCSNKEVLALVSKDRTTLFHSRKKFKQLYANNKLFKYEFECVKNILNGASHSTRKDVFNTILNIVTDYYNDRVNYAHYDYESVTTVNKKMKCQYFTLLLEFGYNFSTIVSEHKGISVRGIGEMGEVIKETRRDKVTHKNLTEIVNKTLIKD
jgi:hypothetical protein